MSKRTNYEERLSIPLDGGKRFRFKTESGTTIAYGFTRVVIGDRGPYVEFSEDQMYKGAIIVPMAQRWRMNDKYRHCYYHEYRSCDESQVKIYFQQRTVDYADYRIGYYYISPFDLYISGKKVIEEL